MLEEAKVGRRIGDTLIFSFSALLMSAFTYTTSQAQTAFVLGGGFAQDCYVAVKAKAPSRSARLVCDRALETETLSRDDLAATLVNRGVISLRERDGDRALSDFDAALRQDPSLSAVFLNRAGAYLLQGRWLDAVVDADTALKIGLTEDEWAAHFNRGVALERLGQITDAYTAFQRSATLAPDRPEIRNELARFRVKSAPLNSGDQ
jgi:tetratricopeptide (TPR) repeat protein